MMTWQEHIGAAERVLDKAEEDYVTWAAVGNLLSIARAHLDIAAFFYPNLHSRNAERRRRDIPGLMRLNGDGSLTLDEFVGSMSDEDKTRVHKILVSAQEVIGSKDKWTTGLLFNPQGQHCVRGAVYLVVNGEDGLSFRIPNIGIAADRLLSYVAEDMGFRSNYPYPYFPHSTHVFVNNTWGYLTTMRMLDRAIKVVAPPVAVEPEPEFVPIDIVIPERVLQDA